jgi:Ser/Thr protein kinase RdoA (MazF antagonist)
MSGPAVDNPPAWQGLVPSRPDLQPAGEELDALLARAVGLEGKGQRIANAGDGMRFFRFLADNGSAYFVKIVAAGRAEELAKAERIAGWLLERGVPVIAALGAAPRPFDDARRAFIYSYFQGRFAEPTEASLIGRALATLHGALRQHPDRNDWERATAARMTRLSAVRRAHATGKRRSGPDPSRFAGLAADDDVEFRPEAFGELGVPCPSHGDLNVFNILVKGDEPRFLDFEDVVHSVLPVAFDIATACERLILVRELDDRRARAAVRAFISAYESEAGHSIGPVSRLPDVLRGLALRALCVLAEIDPEGRHAGEWRKFLHLVELADRRRPVFN